MTTAGECSNHFATGSATARLSSSSEVSVAAMVTGLIIEAMRKMVSRCMGSPSVDIAVAERASACSMSAARHPGDGPSASRPALMDWLMDR